MVQTKMIKTMKFYNTEVSLNECWAGRVIYLCDTFDKNDSSCYRPAHIVGFARNSQGELILRVLHDDGDITPMHPGNCVIDMGGDE